MKLHDDQTSFQELVTLTSQKIGIREVFIEKDYWVTFVLKNLSKSKFRDEVVFKGGTSLSKVHKLISRFSEDIDLAYVVTDMPAKKRYQEKFSKIDKSMTLTPLVTQAHPDEKKGPPQFRKTFYKYPRLINANDFGDASDLLTLEINSFTTPVPYRLMTITSYIADYLAETGQHEAIKEFELEGFEINVLDKKRTLAEKLCGLAKFTNKPDDQDFDFFKKKIRHLYDVSKLLGDPELKEFVKDNEFLDIVKAVRAEDLKSFPLEPWTKKKFSEAQIYSNTDLVLEKIKDHYKTQFSSLLYTNEKLPEISVVSEQVKNIYTYLKSLDSSEDV